MRWCILAFVVLSSVPALAQVGMGSFSGPATLKVKPGCGKDTERSTWDVVGTGGTWTSTIDGGAGPSGTSTPRGNSGRIWELAFDANSKSLIDIALTAWASELCELPVALDAPSEVRRFDLKLNTRKTRGKLTLRARAEGSTSEGAGTGTLKMIKRGPWQEAPQI
jgi:hypothetical protein